jgi:amino acid adenylation domain-containing protein
MNELLHGLMEEVANSSPDSIAVVFNGENVSYRELDAMANRIAQQLAQLDVRRGDRVGLYLEKSPESLACIYGVLKVGAAYVPLAPDGPTARLSRVLGDGGIRVLLSGLERAQQWPDLLADPASAVEYVVCVNGDVAGTHKVPGAKILDTADLAMQPDSRLTVPVAADDLAYVLYTSGSTGAPKGVMLTHRNALSFVGWAVREFALTRRDRLSNHAPLHFGLTIFDFFAAAAVGAAVVIVPREVAMFPAELAAFVRANDISVWYSVPSAVNMLASRGGLEPGELHALRLILFVGEVFLMPQLQLALAQFPNAEFYNLYGPTETNICTFYHVPRPLPKGSTPIPIGQPIDGVELACITDNGREAEINERGDLWVSGPTVMRGYLGDPEQSARVLRSLDPARPDLIAYCTGDLVARDQQGLWHFFGRRDRQIKSRGYRIELGEIEASLSCNDSVLECAVVAMPDARYGNLIKAYFVSNEAITGARLAAYLRQWLPSYMVPFSFDRLTALPRTSRGKVDYQVLSRMAEGSDHAERG